MLGGLLSIAAVVTTVILVMVTDATPATKVAAAAFCLGTFVAPRVVPALWIAAGPAQAALSIAVIVHLKRRGLID